MNAVDLARANACEVRKVAYRQSKDGMVVSFLLHPAEVPDDLVTAPIGQRYQLVMVRIGDDEQPEAPAPRPQKAAKRRWHEIPASQRAAILCHDEAFQNWLGVRGRPEARTEDTARHLRERCGVFSRAHLDTDDDARRRFERIEEDFQIAVGRVPPPR
jgi:hypothetical protein